MSFLFEWTVMHFALEKVEDCKMWWLKKPGTLFCLCRYSFVSALWKATNSNNEPVLYFCSTCKTSLPSQDGQKSEHHATSCQKKGAMTLSLLGRKSSALEILSGHLKNTYFSSWPASSLFVSSYLQITFSAYPSHTPSQKEENHDSN